MLLESHEVIIIFRNQKSQQQSQILRPNYKRISLSLKIDTKVSVLISKIETGYSLSLNIQKLVWHIPDFSSSLKAIKSWACRYNSMQYAPV